MFFSLEATDITVLPAGDGDFDAYMDSVIYKIKSYEMIAVCDGKRYLIDAEYDEQVGTTVGIRLHMDRAVPFKRVLPTEAEA